MSAHTKGPWRVLPVEAADYLRIRGGHLGGRYKIANVHAPLMQSEEAESMANARLISAAPDLAFQLLAAANYIDALGGDSKSYRVTLAKATS